MVDDELEEVTSAKENDVVEEDDKKRKFPIGDTIVQILKSNLQYLIVAIIAFLVAWFTSKSNINEVGIQAPKQLVDYDPQHTDIFVRRQAGSDWTMEEMTINTADEDSPHIVKAKIVVSYDDDKENLLSELSLRSTEIHSEVRSIIGAKKYVDINTTAEQKILAKEIKTRVQLIVGLPGIIDIFFKNFTVH